MSSAMGVLMLLLFLLISIASTEATAVTEAPPKNDSSRFTASSAMALSPTVAPYKYNLLVMQWGAAVCKRDPKISEDPTKRPDPKTSTKECDHRARQPTKFTIHGLWPQETTTHACDKTFDPYAIPPTLKDKLNRVWPDVYYNGLPGNFNLAFWSHEWSDHGCLSGLSIADYFQFAVDLSTRLGDLNADLITEAVCGRDAPGGGRICKPEDMSIAYAAKYPDRQPNIKCTVNKQGKSQIQEVVFKVSAGGVFQPITSGSGCYSKDSIFPRA